MYIWSRVPCSRERELGGPYHWGGGGARDPESGLIYIYIYIYIYMYGDRSEILMIIIITY